MSIVEHRGTQNAVSTASAAIAPRAHTWGYALCQLWNTGPTRSGTPARGAHQGREHCRRRLRRCAAADEARVRRRRGRRRRTHVSAPRARTTHWDMPNPHYQQVRNTGNAYPRARGYAYDQ